MKQKIGNKKYETYQFGTQKRSKSDSLGMIKILLKKEMRQRSLSFECLSLHKILEKCNEQKLQRVKESFLLVLQCLLPRTISEKPSEKT